MEDQGMISGIQTKTICFLIQLETIPEKKYQQQRQAQKQGMGTV